MSKIARTIFLFIGGIFPIFIGGLHTFVHFNQLVTPDIEQFLQQEFIILGQSQSLWNTWGIMSFMMGVSMIIIGLINLSIVKKLSKTDFPPTLPLLAMMIFQLCVIYVGHEFKQGFQFYGGILGEGFLLVGLVLTLNHRLET